jgi:oxygen-independent coproporphyrinogen III oxidase
MADLNIPDSSPAKHPSGNNDYRALYPGPAAFIDTFNPKTYLNQINKGGASRRPLFIDLHFPFCDGSTLQRNNGLDEKKTHHDAAINQYVDYLIKEIRLLRKFCQHTPIIEQIAIDGGMHMLLDRHQFERLIQALHQNFRLSQTTIFSTTLYPQFCRNTSISIYREIGISEITIDVQNFGTHDLQHCDEQTAIYREFITLDAIHAAQRTGFATIRITLDCNITESLIHKFDAALKKIIDTHPNRIDLSYVGESAENNVTEDQIHARLHTARLLSNAGYIHIGLNSFARHDDPLVKAQQQGRLHYGINGYSTFPDSDILALGVSAIGKMGAILVQKHQNLAHYYNQLDQNKFPAMRGLELSLDDLLRRSVIYALICHDVIPFESVEAFFSIDFKHYFASELTVLQAYERIGLLEINGEEIAVTSIGRLFIDSICRTFDRYLN